VETAEINRLKGQERLFNTQPSTLGLFGIQTGVTLSGIPARVLDFLPRPFLESSAPMDQIGKSYIAITRVVCRLMAISMIALLATASSANAADPGRAKRVLMISTGSRISPGFLAYERNFIDTLRRLAPARVEFYSEYLDIVRFPSKSYQRLFHDFLNEKYADQRPDLLAFNFVGNLVVAEEFLHQLFPGVKVLLAGLTDEEISEGQLGSGVTGIVQRTDLRGTMELILRLQPKTRRIIVIGGTADVDRLTLTRAEAAARSFTDRVKFDFWSDRSMAEVRRDVKTLPSRTAILLTRMYRDAAGGAFIPPQTAQLIAEVANVPLFVHGAASVGGGAVGGSVTDAPTLGKQTGELASRILFGASSASTPLVVREEGISMFDWRALKRWGISESHLPPGSVVRFRPATMWEQYGWYFPGALIIIAVQTMLIGGLLLHRARRRRAERELRENQQLLELATSANELGLWVRNAELGDLWANPSLRSLFGLGPNGTIRFDDLAARIHPDDREPIVSAIRHAQQNGLPFEGEFRVINPEGRDRWVAARGRIMDGQNEHGLRRMGAVFDISERKQAQYELDRHREELAHAGRVSVMGQLASSLAHELNQPLGAILRNAEAAELFLQASPPDLREVAAILADIRNDDQRAGEVIDRMRALLKRREPQWSELDLNTLVEEVASLVRPDAERRKVNLALELAPTALPVRGDVVQLQQVLLNFLLNAMDALNDRATEERRISVRTRAADGQAEIAVSDTGRGIAPENLKRLFEPFFTTKANGMGLGLAISQTIIGVHGGRIAAENNRDGGATFRITLPVVGSVEGRGTRAEG
jgi:PAS domain S-box-containing protein